ncbi:MAG TPA: AAA-associated domain-containing protein [Thermoplasmata archaeon]|nr:AAA-associated domain-containing protein [Thermoplasmata archaeon]
MPTTYPKCSPTEMQGLLVLLNSHKGSEDVALLADDLDLEIDEILPSLDFASALGLVKVSDGRATFTDLGKRYIAASIRDRKALLREQLGRTTLFKTLLRALDSAPEHRLTDEQLAQLFSVTPATADESIQNIVNWGRYTELIRYDAAEHLLTAVRRTTATGKTVGGSRPPPSSGPQSSHPTPTSPPRKSTSAGSPGEQASPLVATVAA